MIPRCPHRGPCLCAANARLRRLAQGERPRRSRRGRRAPAPRETGGFWVPPAYSQDVIDYLRAAGSRSSRPSVTTHVVLHLSPVQRDGTCPSCRRPLDDSSCQVLKATALEPNGLGLVALSSVACTGSPTSPLVVRLGGAR